MFLFFNWFMKIEVLRQFPADHTPMGNLTRQAIQRLWQSEMRSSSSLRSARPRILPIDNFIYNFHIPAIFVPFENQPHQNHIGIAKTEFFFKNFFKYFSRFDAHAVNFDLASRTQANIKHRLKKLAMPRITDGLVVQKINHTLIGFGNVDVPPEV